MKQLLYFVLMIACVSCGVETVERTSKAKKSSYTPQAPISFDADIITKQGLSFSYDGTTLFNEDVSSGHIFTLINAPAWLSVDTNTGELTGEPTENILEEDIKIRATKISDASTKDTEGFSIGVNGDPLRKYAWHLQNTGQSNFSSTSGTAGIDINNYNVLKDGNTGQGVTVVISDSGVEINHDDLYLNAIKNEHKNYSTASPYFGTPTPTSAHGTAVAGIILATGWNNRGSIGIAPNSNFVGYQFLDSAQTSSILIDQASGDYDIYNYSYGETLYFDTDSDEDYLDYIKNGFLNDDKIYVKSAGNEYIQIPDEGSNRTCVSHNANMPFEHESPYLLVIGAVDATGKKAFYSNAGSNLWAVGTGGGTGSSNPAIMSTDLPTCFKGYSSAEAYQTNSFEYNHPLNTNCHYTSSMNGTSAAAPSVSGVVALLKAANPSLSSRDIKHILASTSSQVDPSFINDWGNKHPSEVYSNCANLSLAGHTYEQGWVTNSAGYKFSNFYGFGLVDAEAAVAMADGYSSTLGTLVEKNADYTDPNYYSGILALSIPDHDANGVENQMNITDNLTIEAVQIEIDITHPASGQLGVELTSPSGTKSILLNINNSLLIDGDSNLSTRLLSNAFYGESLIGTWTLKVIDGKMGEQGTLNNWKMHIVGH